MSEEEFADLIDAIAQQLRTARTVDDRRNLVMVLDGSGMRRSEIAKAVCKPFGISIKTLDLDLRWVRDYWLDYAAKLTREKAMAQVLKTNTQITRRAMAKGDLSNANRANELLADVTRLKDPLEISDPNAQHVDSEQQRARITALLAARRPQG